TASGGLAVELPYLMLEFFELTANDSVYYRILTEDGLADIGNQDLPLPRARLPSNTPVFYDRDYLGATIRIAALARPMFPPPCDRPGGLRPLPPAPHPPRPRPAPPRVPAALRPAGRPHRRDGGRGPRWPRPGDPRPDDPQHRARPGRGAGLHRPDRRRRADR